MFVLSAKLRLRMSLNENKNDDVVGVFPAMNTPEMMNAIKDFQNERFTEDMRTGQVRNNVRPASMRFFDRTCERFENVMFTEDKKFTPEEVENWKNEVPPHWKTSFASNFQERAVVTDTERGN